MPTELLYRIIDEPRGSSLRSWVANPFWPWLALMMGGVWIGTPWFIFNSFAMGSPFKKKDTILSVALPFLIPAGFIGLILVAKLVGISETGLKYVVLPAIVIKMIVGYVLFISQSRAFQLHQQFHPVARNAAIIAVAAFYLSDKVGAALPPILRLALM